MTLGTAVTNDEELAARDIRRRSHPPLSDLLHSGQTYQVGSNIGKVLIADLLLREGRHKTEWLANLDITELFVGENPCCQIRPETAFAFVAMAIQTSPGTPSLLAGGGVPSRSARFRVEKWNEQESGQYCPHHRSHKIINHPWAYVKGQYDWRSYRSRSSLGLNSLRYNFYSCSLVAWVVASS